MNAPQHRTRRTRDAVFIDTFERSSAVQVTSDALRIGIKDLIDIRGSLTTAGSRAVQAIAAPALSDAALMSAIRDAETRGNVVLVGKTNLHELAYGGDGMNNWFGTPPNPLDHNRVPGGSSSGSAAAIGFDRVDVAIGSDTGGSIRIPAACCGVVGLKPTWGVVPSQGVWALAPTLDTIGPMGRDVQTVRELMNLLVPGFTEQARNTAADHVGFAASPGEHPVDPILVESCRRALRVAGLAVNEVSLPWWTGAVDQGLTVLIGEAFRTLQWLLENHEAGLEPRIATRIRLGSSIPDAQLQTARNCRAQVARNIADDCARYGLIATPTLPMLPPHIDDQAAYAPYTAFTRPANLAGTPAIAIPIPLVGASRSLAHLRASLQLMGPAGSEDTLLATARRIEAAVLP
jgi:amidase